MERTNEVGIMFPALEPLPHTDSTAAPEWDTLISAMPQAGIAQLAETIGYSGGQRVIIEEKLRNLYRAVLSSPPGSFSQILKNFHMSEEQYYMLLWKHPFATELLQQEVDALKSMGTLGAAELLAVRHMPTVIERMMEIVKQGSDADTIKAASWVATVAGVDKKTATANMQTQVNVKFEFAQERPGFPVRDGKVVIDV